MTKPHPHPDPSQPAPLDIKMGMSRSKFLLIAFTLITIWGSAFTMTDVAVRSLSPIWIVASRMSLAALLVTIYIFIKGYSLPALTDKRWLWYGFIGSVGTSLPFFLITLGQKTVTSGLSAILIGAMPLLTIILAHFFTEERMTCLLYTSPSPRDRTRSRMPSSA